MKSKKKKQQIRMSSSSSRPTKKVGIIVQLHAIASQPTKSRKLQNLAENISSNVLKKQTSSINIAG